MERFAEKEERIRYLEQELIQAGIHLEEGQIHQLETYYQMLVEKNKVMNLTGPSPHLRCGAEAFY